MRLPSPARRAPFSMNRWKDVHSPLVRFTYSVRIVTLRAPGLREELTEKQRSGPWAAPLVIRLPGALTLQSCLEVAVVPGEVGRAGAVRGLDHRGGQVRALNPGQ